MKSKIRNKARISVTCVFDYGLQPGTKPTEKLINEHMQIITNTLSNLFNDEDSDQKLQVDFIVKVLNYP